MAKKEAMTKEEAMARFGIKESDNISKEGLENLIKCTKQQLAIWSLNAADKAELEKDLEAYEVLMEV